MAEKTISQSYLRSIIRYEPDTGKFYWITRRARHVRAGDEAGSLRGGYRVIVIDARCYQSHRLAWLYVTGSFPAHLLDHINRIKDDNRWANLRECTQAENMRNCGKHSDNTSGFKGVSRSGNRWQARARLNGEPVRIGYFSTAQDASRAYNDFAREHYGQFHQEECAQ